MEFQPTKKRLQIFEVFFHILLFYIFSHVLFQDVSRMGYT